MADVFDVAQKAQQGIQSATSEGINQGVTLAKMAQSQEQNKMQLAQQREELEQKKFQNMTGRLNTLMRSSPQISKVLWPKFEEAMSAQGTPVDPGLKDALSDPAFKMRMQKALVALQESASPEARAESLQALSDMGMLDEGLKMIESAQARSFQGKLKQQEMGADAARQAKSDELKERELSQKDEERVENKAEKLSKDLAPLGAISETFNEINELIPGGIYGEGKVPGFEGPAAAAADIPLVGGAIERVAMSRGERDLRGAVQKLMNLELRDLSGAAVTVPEFERFKKSYQAGAFASSAELRKGLQRAADGIRAKMKTLEAGAGARATAKIREGGGATSEAIPKKKEAIAKTPAAALPTEEVAAKTGIDPAKIEAYKKLKGIK